MLISNYILSTYGENKMDIIKNTTQEAETTGREIMLYQINNSCEDAPAYCCFFWLSFFLFILGKFLIMK